MDEETASEDERNLTDQEIPPRKRPRSSSAEDDTKSTRRRLIVEPQARPVPPPPLRKFKTTPEIEDLAPTTSSSVFKTSKSATAVIKSPFELTWIRDLPASSNVDAVSLKDILGDPLIAECWNFNYLHDLDFLMDAFDPDVKDLVEVNVVHGFWKREDESRIRLREEAAKYPNITLHAAFMPEMFGTHHSKMLILLRHDETAQVIIHTANMIPFDWANMTQALWRSELLPKLISVSDYQPPSSTAIDSGARFKIDLLNYLKAYDSKRTITKRLVNALREYDFSSIKAALIASVPGRQEIDTREESSWGWPGLKKALAAIPASGSKPEIQVQISSIASLGSNDKWLNETLFKSLKTCKNDKKSEPKFKIIFPTADEIRRSLNGYISGKAIHTKIQTPAQQKQVQYLKPLLHHWAGDGATSETIDLEDDTVRDAGRKRAAPHIKTYIRFVDDAKEEIEWVLVSSANLSKQAWGEAVNGGGEVRICSYEIGVLVWPQLYGEGAKMVPTFKTDTPEQIEGEVRVGARMPYDLPLVPYGRGDLPWCATANYAEPDWMGQTYNTE